MSAAVRYVAWLRRVWPAVAALAVVALGASAWLIAFRLPLHADFADLLPPDAPAVRDLRRLEARISAQDTLLVIVESTDPGERAAAAAQLAARIRALPASLVARVEDDDAATRAFLRDHRELLVPLPDLEAARDALAKRIARAKLEGNPLFIELDDTVARDTAAATTRLDELRAKRRDAEARLDRSSFVSADATTQLLVVRTGFAKTNIAAGGVLYDALARVRTAVIADHPRIAVGFAGGTIVSLAEHDALVHGMILSSLVTAILVGLVLAFYFWSMRLLVVLGGTLVVATAMAFGFAAITVGHLNAATAFLGAIIAGNGINYGILLIARYRDESRERTPDAAMARAITGTLRPTLVASLGAAIAYGSLAATSFKGFADFAIIGSIGMLVCWIVTYTLVPALVLRFAPESRIGLGAPALGAGLVRLLGALRPARVLGVVAALAIVAIAIAVCYVAADPFEYDMKNLRSAGDDAVLARTWMAKSDAAFGRGIAGQTFIATDSVDEVRRVVAALGRIDRPGRPATIGSVRSILEVVPDDQPKRLAVLAEIRTQLDANADALSDDDRRELLELRPPDHLAPIAIGDLPPSLLDNLRERDGRIGLLVGVRPSATLDEWNGKDLIRFASAVRRLELPGGGTVTTSGSSVVFADIIEAIQDDGVRVTGIAALGLIVMVLGVVGRNRRAVAVLAAVGVGALGLVAACALLDIKVNFLDFVALPITLGLGVDYAINVAHRQHEDHDLAATMRSSGTAVFICSLTTIIGYGSLLVSDNLAIRGFGVASLIGEVCCLTTALVLVPAIVSFGIRGQLGTGHGPKTSTSTPAA